MPRVAIINASVQATGQTKATISIKKPVFIESPERGTGTEGNSIGSRILALVSIFALVNI